MHTQNEQAGSLTNFFDEYTRWTDTVAQYPPAVEGAYLALGIANELGELIEKREDVSVGQAEWRSNVRKEAGDVCWYLARYGFRVLRHPTSSVISSALFDYEERPYPIDVEHVVQAAGVIAGVEKKRIRDGETWDQAKEEHYNERAHKAARVLWGYLSQVLEESGKCSLVDVMQQNQQKLEKRLVAGSIRGEGDAR